MSWRRKVLSRQVVCLCGTDAGDPAETVRLLEYCGFCVRTSSREDSYDLYGTWTAEGFDALTALTEGSDLTLTEALADLDAPCEGMPVKSRVRFTDGRVQLFLDRRHSEQKKITGDHIQ